MLFIHSFLYYKLIFHILYWCSFYDITTGLDFNKYIKNIYFLIKSSIVFDSQGTLYFWSIAKLSDFPKKCI